MGERFESVEVREDGRDRPLVDGTRIVVTVDDDGSVAAEAGCNAMSVQGGVVDGRLTGSVVMTLKSCGDDRDEQDRWLNAFLGTGPTWERDGDELRLTADGTSVVLVAAPGGSGGQQ